MARVVVGNPEVIRPRWSRWLRDALQAADLSARELGMMLSRRKEADSGGAYPGLVMRWTDEQTTVSPEMAFIVGELLRERVGWCSGLVALYAAGYLGDYAAVLGAIARQSPGEPALYAFVNAVPLLGGRLPVPRDESYAIVHDRAHRSARTIVESANAGFNFEPAFARRTNRIDADLEAVRTLATNRELAAPIVERCGLLLIDEWARRLWYEHVYSDDGTTYDDVRELAVAREDIIAQNARESASGIVERIIADAPAITDRAINTMKKGELLAET